jgi:hypothetical protein
MCDILAGDWCQFDRGPLGNRRWAVTASAILLAGVGMSELAPGQDQSAAIAKDEVFARKILMDAIGRNMDEIEGMMASPKGVDMAEGREHADNISIMLMAFHLIRPESWGRNIHAEIFKRREQRRIRRAFLAHPDRLFRTVELAAWAYPVLAGKVQRKHRWAICRAAKRVAVRGRTQVFFTASANDDLVPNPLAICSPGAIQPV